MIGADGAIPWRLKSDMQRFKALTVGKPVVMGRKTFESIGRLLPGRTMLVISGNKAYRRPGIIVCHSFAEGLSAAASDSEVFVIGGERIFRDALPVAQRLYLTRIEQ